MHKLLATLILITFSFLLNAQTSADASLSKLPADLTEQLLKQECESQGDCSVSNWIFEGVDMGFKVYRPNDLLITYKYSVRSTHTDLYTVENNKIVQIYAVYNEMALNDLRSLVEDLIGGVLKISDNDYYSLDLKENHMIGVIDGSTTWVTTPLNKDNITDEVLEMKREYLAEMEKEQAIEDAKQVKKDEEAAKAEREYQKKEDDRLEKEAAIREENKYNASKAITDKNNEYLAKFNSKKQEKLTTQFSQQSEETYIEDWHKEKKFKNLKLFVGVTAVGALVTNYLLKKK